MRHRSEIADLLATCRKAALPLVSFTAGINVLMLTTAIYMLQVYDRVLSSHSLATLGALTAMAVIALATMAALEAFRTLMLVKVSTWLGRRLTPVVLRHTVGEMAGRETLTSTALRDVEQLRSFLSGPAITPLLDAPWAPLFLIVIFLIHPWLGFFALGGALSLLLLAIYAERSTRALLEEASKGQRQVQRAAEATLRNADAMQAMGMLDAFLRRWQDCIVSASAIHEEAGCRSGHTQAFARFLRFVLQVGILGMGALLVLRQDIQAGSMIAASIILGRAMAPVEQAIGALRATQGARAAYHRLKTLSISVGEERSHLPLPRPEGRLSVENLSVRVGEAIQPVLQAVTFQLEPGDSLGIVGSTGSGKSSLARAIVGALRPTSGAVRLDSMDVARWASADRGKYVGYLPQDVELVGRTVGEVIGRFDDVRVPEVAEAIIAAARMADLHETIKALPHGYDTEVGEGGMFLSGGQRQRIGLARALYRLPPLVVLDEPNANLDHRGEEALIASIARLKSLRTTTVIVAHRQRILETADYLLVLEHGRVELFGPRAHVLARMAAGIRAVAPVVHHGSPRPQDGKVATL